MRPVVHQHTWDIVRQLAERGQVPEWKVMHLAVVLLEQTVRERPVVLELLHSVGGDVGPVDTPAPLPPVTGGDA